MLYPNMTWKIRKKMWNILRWWKYSNETWKVQKWSSILRLWSVKIGSWVKYIWCSESTPKTPSNKMDRIKNKFSSKFDWRVVTGEVAAENRRGEVGVELCEKETFEWDQACTFWTQKSRKSISKSRNWQNFDRKKAEKKQKVCFWYKTMFKFDSVLQWRIFI